MSTDEIVAIIMEDKTYNVSKSKLIENSDYFRALFSSGMRESKENRVQLQGLSAHGLELVLRFINTSQVHVDNDNLEDLIQAATFLQVTAIYKLLLSEICQDNCLELYYLADLYGLVDLRTACLTFMACYYHVMLRREEFRCLPAAFGQQVKDLRMKGRATLMAFGDFSGISQDSLLSMLRYEEVAQRWLPFDCNFPADMVNVRGYGSAVLDNYFFIVGGYRITSQEISAAHCYNPSQNEWIQIASLNQKRSNFKLVPANGKLYAVGGHSLNSVECYSPEMDSWNFVAPLPDPLVEFSACECKGMIYVMGGYTSRDRNMRILCYCPTSDSWFSFQACSFHVRKQQMLSVEDTIYLVGGYTHKIEPNKKTRQSEDMLTVQSYNISTREWLCLKAINSKSGLNLTCTLHNDGIYIMSRDIRLPSSFEHIIFLKYNIFCDVWEGIRKVPPFGRNMLLCSLYLPNVIEL
ncbi:kelch-like protein 42 [Polypterus senegalus]|uniref:kelch-like protein 42 n=1 Tax=Polypterus senegalus TaxID=55291 RepID=UPI00196277F8|nr:kelch-like protein 42 [Polypterus senegalus]